MKRILLPLLLIACLFLSGCGDHAAEKRFTDFSEGLAAKETLSFCADMRVEYADHTLEFTLAYARDADGQTITVQKPERIAGIRAHLAPGSNTLEFEGLILDTGPLDPYGLTPMNALPKLVELLSTGHVDTHWESDGFPVYRLILDDHLSASVWFDPSDMIPTRAEIQSDETVHIFCDLYNWS